MANMTLAHITSQILPLAAAEAFDREASIEISYVVEGRTIDNPYRATQTIFWKKTYMISIFVVLYVQRPRRPKTLGYLPEPSLGFLCDLLRAGL